MIDRFEELLKTGPIVINIGVEGFAESIQEQRSPVVHVVWSPPAGGDEAMADLLDKLL
jgi:FdrA protein